MEISGDNSKFNDIFGEVNITTLSQAIAKTISYYNDQHKPNKDK
jgi:hypothetical protein